MQTAKEKIASAIQAARETHGYRAEKAILQFIDAISGQMKELGMAHKDLAFKLDVKPSYVSKIFRGTSNFTLDSIIKICSAVEAEFHFEIRQKKKQAEPSSSPSGDIFAPARAVNHTYVQEGFTELSFTPSRSIVSGKLTEEETFNAKNYESFKSAAA